MNAIGIEYTLPEWVFLDGKSHQGNTLKNRTVILHTRSATVIEVICHHGIIAHSEFTGVQHEYIHTYKNGIEVKYTFVAHYSAYTILEDSNELPIELEKEVKKILLHCSIWYRSFINHIEYNTLP